MPLGARRFPAGAGPVRPRPPAPARAAGGMGRSRQRVMQWLTVAKIGNLNVLFDIVYTQTELNRTLQFTLIDIQLKQNIRIQQQDDRTSSTSDAAFG